MPFLISALMKLTDYVCINSNPDETYYSCLLEKTLDSNIEIDDNKRNAIILLG